ncbi:MAG: LytTR family transcriptional regulator, partial [Sphingobacteriales bacterium]
IVLVPVNELQYLESLGNYVKVWAEKEFLLAPRTLTSFEEQLPEDTFFRIHKSFIMNKNFVHYMEGNRIFLKNGTELPIGKNYLSVTKRLLNIEY